MLAVFLVLPCAAVSSLSIDELDANASLLVLLSNPPSGAPDPNFGIPPLLGVSIPIKLGGPFFMEGGLEFLGWYYEWITTTGTAVITQAENGVGFFTIGALGQPSRRCKLPGFLRGVPRRSNRPGLPPAISFRAAEHH